MRSVGRGMKSRNKQKNSRNPAGREGLPVSLYPLSFQDAVSGPAQVRMPLKEKPKATPEKDKG
jgi:hypothetical protein